MPEKNNSQANSKPSTSPRNSAEAKKLEQVTGRTLFGYFAGTIKRACEKYGKTPVWHIMPRVLNNSATREFFRANDFFGLDPQSLAFF